VAPSSDNDSRRLTIALCKGVADTARLASLTSLALRQMQRTHDLATSITAYDEAIAKDDDERNRIRAWAEKRLKKAEDDAKFVKKEVEAGFPFMMRQALVSMWGQLCLR